ncbi:MFS transporter [Nakamurella aerolata]|uniref:MFS transporter n=1 Tax=Nakamurella aerolata TaxID=1656892 RepID=A0A849A800_9ACTN|nr:MFS transporter [Nakamurella aerolata]NNG36147.1 MFS transporter [Nakamurella aerolata]
MARSALDITETHPPATAPSDRAVTGALAFAVFGYALAQTLVVPALAPIQADLRASPAIGAWVLSAFLLAGAVLSPIVGALGDGRGPRNVLVVTLGVFAVGSVAAVIAPTIEVLIAARIVQGVSLAILPLSFAVVRRVVSGARQTSAAAVLAGIGGAGAGVGLVIGGLLTDLLSWHALFGLGAILAALAGGIVLAVVPTDPTAGRTGGHFDLLGAVMLTIGLTTILVGLTQGTSWGWTSVWVWLIVAAGLAVLVLLGLVERRRSRPLLDVAELADPGLVATHLTALLIGAVSYPFYLLLPLWAQAGDGSAPNQVGFGGSITLAGLILLPGALTLLLGSALTTKLAARTGPRTPLVAGFGLIAVATLALAGWHQHIWQHVVCYAVVGLGTGFVFASQPRLISVHVPVRRTGAANGFNNIARSVGSILTTQITAAIVAATTSATVPVTDATLSIGLALTAGLCLLGLVAATFTTKGAQQ